MDSKGFKTHEVLPVYAMSQTTIPIDSDTRDELRAEKVGNETYSDVIERLIDGDADE